jgi:GNAT superfamily N-acetyltransferase
MGRPRGAPSTFSGVEVRRIAEDDWALLREVRLAALADAPHAFGTTRADAERYPEARWRQQAGGTTADGRPSATFLGGDGDGRADGMAVGIDTGEATLVVGVWVARQARGRGLFDLLMDAVESWSPHRRLVLDVARGNDRARRAYERRGFVVTGPSDEACEWRMERT